MQRTMAVFQEFGRLPGLAISVFKIFCLKNAGKENIKLIIRDTPPQNYF